MNIPQVKQKSRLNLKLKFQRFAVDVAQVTPARINPSLGLLFCILVFFPHCSASVMTLPRQPTYLVALVLLVLLATSAAASHVHGSSCPQLDAYCNNLDDPGIRSCYKAVEADGATLPLYARFDTDASHGPKEWRCYSGSTLSADK